MNSDHDERLAALLRGHQAAILAAWQDLVLASFPEQTARFLRRETDAFHNPLGTRIREGTQGVVGRLTALGSPRDSVDALDTLVRVRAIQGQPASAALEFVFALKNAVRSALGESLPESDARTIDRYIDGLALVAFDVYVRCREEILQIRVREAQRCAHALLSRFAPVLDVESEAPGPDGDGRDETAAVLHGGARS